MLKGPPGKSWQSYFSGVHVSSDFYFMLSLSSVNLAKILQRNLVEKRRFTGQMDYWLQIRGNGRPVQILAETATRVDTKWRIKFFAKYDYRFLLDVIIATIAISFAKAIIAISRLLLRILLE